MTAASDHACALDVDGRATCWALGTQAPTEPTQPADTGRLVRVLGPRAASVPPALTRSACLRVYVRLVCGSDLSACRRRAQQRPARRRHACCVVSGQPGSGHGFGQRANEFTHVGPGSARRLRFSGVSCWNCLSDLGEQHRCHVRSAPRQQEQNVLERCAPRPAPRLGRTVRRVCGGRAPLVAGATARPPLPSPLPSPAPADFAWPVSRLRRS